MNIPGVPESIPRADYTRLIESVGLDPKDLMSLRFGHRTITATVRARNPETGELMLNTGGADAGLVKHIIMIPIEDKKEPAK